MKRKESWKLLKIRRKKLNAFTPSTKEQNRIRTNGHSFNLGKLLRKRAANFDFSDLLTYLKQTSFFYFFISIK